MYGNVWAGGDYCVCMGSPRDIDQRNTLNTVQPFGIRQDHTHSERGTAAHKSCTDWTLLLHLFCSRYYF